MFIKNHLNQCPPSFAVPGGENWGNFSVFLLHDRITSMEKSMEAPSLWSAMSRCSFKYLSLPFPTYVWLSKVCPVQVYCRRGVNHLPVAVHSSLCIEVMSCFLVRKPWKRSSLERVCVEWENLTLTLHSAEEQVLHWRAKLNRRESYLALEQQKGAEYGGLCLPGPWLSVLIFSFFLMAW